MMFFGSFHLSSCVRAFLPHRTNNFVIIYVLLALIVSPLLTFSCQKANTPGHLPGSSSIVGQNKGRTEKYCTFRFSEELSRIFFKRNGLADSWLRFYDLTAGAFRSDPSQPDTCSLLLYSDAVPDGEGTMKGLPAFSPDSSMFIGIDGYMSYGRDSLGQYVFEGRDADQEAQLIDISNNVCYSLLFVGPCSRIDDAFWFDDNTICILGIIDEGKGSYPSIWIFDIKNHYYHFLISDRPYRGQPGSYLEEVRLKKVNSRLTKGAD